MSNNSSSSNDPNNQHVCRICSDRAIGYNFSVLTCEPCKAFFRRTADKLEELQCPFNNDCDIDKITRKICRRCRLVKCLKVGMRKDWAQSDDEKKSRFENCTNLSRGCGSVKSSTISSRSSNYNCKDNLLRDFKMCNKLTSRSFVKDNDSISSNRNTWSSLSLPTPSPSPSSSSLSMSSAKMGASFMQLSGKSTSSCSSPSSSLQSSKSCSNLNRYGPNKQHSGLMPAPCSSSASSSSSSSSIIPTIDLMNSLQRTYYPQSNCKQPRQDIQSILKSDSNSDWLIRFLVESHALNLPTSRLSVDQLNSESSIVNKTDQSSTIRATETATCLQQPQPQSSSSSSSRSESNPCTRVGVIVDGRKLAPSPTPMISSKKTCVYPPGLSCSDRQKQQPPSLTPINQTDCNLKARVIRKILDANFAPSHLKQGCRKGFALDDLESETIDSLVNAFDFFNQPLTVNNCELTSIEGVTQFTDLYLEKLISGCRCLSSYSKLCLEDQITLVKGGFPDILTVKSHFCASMSTTSSSPRPSDNCWQKPLLSTSVS
ncbi:protein embryonic gonad-like isoform X2 [Panonychus citri]|uniref:protein embryonic gonad-like isoform X2 n=1 Tax=Panonychus citri TaxID=50023 RepID=UPI002307B6CF|nr:protein embryonic gonad-like isoform X2 [Panonychus citri]